MKILYLTYENVYKTGILQAQVLTPLNKLNIKYDIDFTVTSILKKDDDKDAIYKKNKYDFQKTNSPIKIVEFSKNVGHTQSLFSFVMDIIRMYMGVFQLAKDVDLVHARGYGGCVLALLLKIFTKKKYIFDMRGVLPEETVYVGKIKPNSLKYHLMKLTEKALLKYSSYIFVVSKPFEKYIEKFHLEKPIYNISNPADFSLFENKKKWDKIKILYSGSLQNWHCAKETYQFFKTIKHEFNTSVQLIVCANDIEGHENLSMSCGLTKSEVTIQKIPFAQMPKIISESHIGFCLTKQTFLTSVCLPVKFGEYIAGNLSVISNELIGDIPEIIKKNNAGLCLATPEYTTENYQKIRALIIELLDKRVVKYERENVESLNWDNTIDDIYCIYEGLINEK